MQIFVLLVEARWWESSCGKKYHCSTASLTTKPNYNMHAFQPRNMTEWWPIWGWKKFAPRQNEQLNYSLDVFTLPQDDILTAAYCPPNYLATASFDGDIILWGLDREKMIRRLKKGSGSLLWVANAKCFLGPILFAENFCHQLFHSFVMVI